MVRRELKHRAKRVIFTDRKPHFVMVTLLYLLVWVALMQLVVNLSDFGRFWSETVGQATAELDAFARFGLMPAFRPPIFELTLFGKLFLIFPWIFLWVMELGYLYYVRGTIRGESLGYQSIFEGFNYFFRAILLRFLQALLVGIGLVLLIVPGLILLCGFSQVNLLLLDHPDKGVIWFFKESWRIMRGRKWEYFVLNLSFIGWFLLTEVPYISLAARFWFVPYHTATMVYYYDSITGQGKEPETEWKRPGMF